MSDSISIRLATVEDIPAIHAITQDAFTHYAKDLGLPNQVHALQESFEDIATDLKDKAVLIGFFENEPIGSLRCETVDNCGYISRFGVLEEHRKCGMGKALMLAAEQYARDRQLKALLLHTSAKMFSLIRFYYGLNYYIESTATDRGYIRALLVKPLQEQHDLVRYEPLVGDY